MLRRKKEGCEIAPKKPKKDHRHRKKRKEKMDKERARQRLGGATDKGGRADGTPKGQRDTLGEKKGWDARTVAYQSATMGKPGRTACPGKRMWA
ncbi:hypothetical protein pqer_cds_143 [Pandoravirus quercus]|uniref:Uncharacterized protein n=1 Tax=Pandoravirus quercus TaxID=2107709 RepID=A0A2U7U842_9VIRU|nr:hypothetical protein pqer_cds_143 [Pandoravirus quercus]AVK74565.1 hypothetical protein pqer_cds_143 [Pandoravirus quercus]